MNVPFQVNVPIDLATELRNKLDRLKQRHAAEAELIAKKVKTGGSAKTIAQHDDLAERGRRLTVHNMVRLALTHGLANLVKKSDDQILNLLAEEGVIRGRPRAAV